MNKEPKPRYNGEIPINNLKGLIIKYLDKYKINWPREMNLAKKIFTKKDDYEFYLSLNISNLPSLAYFLTPNGKAFWQQQLNIFNFKPEEKKEQSELAFEKQGEDIIQEKKIKTLKDFLG